MLPGAAQAVKKRPIDRLHKFDSITQAVLVSRGKVSALELAQAAIHRIKTLESKINALITPLFEPALQAVANGLPDGPFAGVPYLLDDMLEYRGYRTTMGSQLFARHIARAQPLFVRQMVHAGCNIMGKSNTASLGLIPTTEPVAFGVCRNPWSIDHAAGGGCGGSAAAVASGMVPSAQGHDRWGSLRISASCCGIFSLKVSRGRNGKQENNSLNVHGHLTRTVRDSAALYTLTQDRGINARFPADEFISRPFSRVLKIGMIMRDFRGKKPDIEVENAILATGKLCREAGHEVEKAVLPFTDEETIRLKQTITTLWAAAGASAYAQLEAAAGTKKANLLLEPWTQYLFERFNTLATGELKESHDSMRASEKTMNTMFDTYDVLLSPVTASGVPLIGKFNPARGDGNRLMRELLRYGTFSMLYNLTGQPAMSVPLNLSDEGLPIGSQFAARAGNERLLLQLAYQLEEAQPWKDSWPPLSAAYQG